jgi:hypothetical protein
VKRARAKLLPWIAVAVLLLFLLLLMAALPKGSLGYAWQRAKRQAGSLGPVPFWDSVLPVLFRQAGRDIEVLDSDAEIRWSATTSYPRAKDQLRIDAWDKAHKRDIEG